jgi:flagellum-specific peptidoglycan hydrolase FlgJ
MIIIRILIGLLFFASTSLSTKNKALTYIDQYSDTAVLEMHRSGIPASIKLAQALVESNSGTSQLALLANNHFGIKCKTYWKGEKYFHKDDDFNKRGQLIDSCFRSYGEAMDSYVDHTNFLLFTDHYGELFHYEKTDYINWAHGLKRCGYATDPAYAIKLIKKIEEFKLYEYDYVTLADLKENHSLNQSLNRIER